MIYLNHRIVRNWYRVCAFLE